MSRRQRHRPYRWRHPAPAPAGRERREASAAHAARPSEWEHRILAEICAAELVDSELPLENLLWRLFHEEEEVRILSTIPLSKGCRCSLEYVREVIARFGPEEREQMVDDDGFISVDCEFCSRLFPIKLSDLDA